MIKGDKVSWISQSQGSVTRKTGTIIEIIPAKTSAKQFLPATAKKSHIKFDVDVCPKLDRVLVEVPAGKNGDILHYYCPYYKALASQGN